MTRNALTLFMTYLSGLHIGRAVMVLVLTLSLQPGVAVAESLLSIIPNQETEQKTSEEVLVKDSDALASKADVETNEEQHLPTDETFTEWKLTDVEQAEDKLEKKIT